jgi:hypothetical protein
MSIPSGSSSANIDNSCVKGCILFNNFRVESRNGDVSGKVTESTPGVNGFHGLRAAAIGAAAKAGPKGWTSLDSIQTGELKVAMRRDAIA